MTCEVEPSKISDWVPICIALLALCAAIWQAGEARKQAAISREHNKMSMLPILISHTSWDNTHEGLIFSIAVKNVGVGVALITDRYFTIDQKRFVPEIEKNIVEELVDNLIGKSLNYKLLTSEFFGKSARIPPGGSYTIVKLIFPKAHSNLREIIEAKIKNVSFEVTYKSVYKEAFTFSTSN